MEVNNQNRLAVWLGKIGVEVVSDSEWECCPSYLPAKLEDGGGGQRWQRLLHAGRGHGLQVELSAERLHQGRLWGG